MFKVFQRTYVSQHQNRFIPFYVIKTEYLY